MDETKLEIELACWIERHPEAGASIIDLDFPRKRGAFALELGTLMWKVEVPDGYANRGKRPAIYQYQYWRADPTRNYVTFKISIVKKGWKENCRNVEDMFQQVDMSGLRIGNHDHDAVLSEATYLDIIINSQELMSGPAQNHKAWMEQLEKSTVVVDRPAESLSNVLDFAYRLTILYENHRMQTADFFEDELELPPDVDKPTLWERIAELVNEAREACKQVAPPRPLVPVSEEKMRKAFKGFDLRSRSNSPALSTLSSASSSSESWVTHFRHLDVNSPSGEVNSRQTGKADSDYSDSEKYFGSDGESSESDWLLISEEEEVSSKKRFTFTSTKKDASASSPSKRKAQQQATQPHSRAPSFKRATPTTFSLPDDSTCLEFCNIEFNSASRSVECSIEVSKFIKPAVARALGLNLNHPLRIEIVPIPVQLGSWYWYADVEVYASQGSDYHYHIPEEEICGLRCLIPTFVQSYLHSNLSYFYNNFPARTISNKASEVNIFNNVMVAIVKRLTCMSDGDFCCVCGKREWAVSRRQVWSCTGNLCQATYETWRSVTTSDERKQAKTASKTEEVKQKLRRHFTFFHQGELQGVLDAYGMETTGMSYEEMISALATIEAWTEDDASSCLGLAWGLMNPGWDWNSDSPSGIGSGIRNSEWDRTWD